jgi:hypothetical protein
MRKERAFRSCTLKMTQDLGHERCTREQGHLAKGQGTRIPTFLPLSVGKLKSHRSMVKRPACVKGFPCGAPLGP